MPLPDGRVNLRDVLSGCTIPGFAIAAVQSNPETRPDFLPDAQTHLYFCAAHICLYKWGFSRLPAGAFSKAQPVLAKSHRPRGEILRVSLCWRGVKREKQTQNRLFLRVFGCFLRGFDVPPAVGQTGFSVAGRLGFVLSHPSIEKIEGWGTRHPPGRGSGAFPGFLLQGPTPVRPVD